MKWLVFLLIVGGCARYTTRKEIESDPSARYKVDLIPPRDLNIQTTRKEYDSFLPMD